MKKSLCLTALVGSLTVPFSSGATAITFDFESETLDDIFADGEVTDWTQDIANPPSINFGAGLTVDFPMAYIQDTEIRLGAGAPVPSGYLFGSGATNAGYLGTFRGNQADGSPTTVSTTFDASTLNATVPQVIMNLGILDDPDDNFESRDDFTVALAGGGGGTLATIGFVQSGLDDDAWNITVSADGAAPTVLAQTALSNTGYTFTVDFESTGTIFSFAPADGSGSSTFLSSQPSVTDFFDNVTGIDITHEPGAVPEDSATALVFDDITIVPEPTSSAFALLGLGLLGLRRRSR